MFKFRPFFRRLSGRPFRVLLGVLSMALAITVAACNQPITTAGDPGGNGGEPTEFRIGYQLTAGPETLVKGLGLIEEAFPNVDVRWQSYDSGRDVNDAIAEGNVDVGLIGSVPVSTGVAKDLPYQVYFIMNILGDNEALAVTDFSKITTTADLPGKTIAVPFGSTTHFSLLAAMEQDGIDPETVQVLDMQPQDMLAAWQFGEIDGGFVWQPILSRMLDEGGTIVTSARELAENGVITADLGVVGKDFAAKYPDFLASYTNALDTAVKLYKAEPEKAAETMSEQLALSPAESLAVMGELVWLTAAEQQSEKYLGTPNAPGQISQVLKDSAEFMVAQGAIPEAPGLAAYEKALFTQAIAQSASN